MRKTVISHGRSPNNPLVQRAERGGQKVRPSTKAAGDENPSVAPEFQGPFSGPAPLQIDFLAYAGTNVYCNPNGGVVNPGLAIVWAPGP